MDTILLHCSEYDAHFSSNVSASLSGDIQDTDLRTYKEK